MAAFFAGSGEQVFLRRYRRHAVVVIVIAAAIITPTGDPFTLSVVAIPLYLLYEMSIDDKRQEETEEEVEDETGDVVLSGRMKRIESYETFLAVCQQKMPILP